MSIFRGRFQQLRRNVTGGVAAAVGQRLGRGALTRNLHEGCDVLGGEILAHHHDHRNADHSGDRYEVLLRVVRQTFVKAQIGGVGRIRAQKKRVSIRRGPLDGLRGNLAVGSGQVLDDDRLPSFLRSSSAMSRAGPSVALPAGNGKTILMGRAGYGCAAAVSGRAAAMHVANVHVREINPRMSPPRPGRLLERCAPSIVDPAAASNANGPRRQDPANRPFPFSGCGVRISRTVRPRPKVERAARRPMSLEENEPSTTLADYLRCVAPQIHFRQCGHRCGGARRMSSRMACRTAGKVG